MKHIIFNLSDDLVLTSCSANDVYALENNSAELILNHSVKAEMVYELHKEQNGRKSYIKLEKGENKLYKLLENSFLNTNGKCSLQVKMIGESDYVQYSNKIEIYINSSINATKEPTPQEASVINELLVKSNENLNTTTALIDEASVLKDKAHTLETLHIEDTDKGIDVIFDDKTYHINDGDKGEKGDIGPQGPQGIPGKDGAVGPMGPMGPTGPQGERGYRGLTGPQGLQGNMGPTGPKGAKGDPGPAGKDGRDGKDGTVAFDDLTPEQKASLKGEKGDKGDPGRDGMDGTVGPEGPKGDRGEKGEPGPQGPQGEQGEPGKDGKDGAGIDDSSISTETTYSSNKIEELLAGLSGLTDEQKDLILSNFLGGVYTDSNGLNLYKALKQALYPDEPTPREGLLEMSDIYKTRYLDGFSISSGNINYGWPNPGYYVFNPEIKKIQIGSIASGWGNNWFIFRKVDDNTYYGIQSGSVVRINDNGSGISITNDSTGGKVEGLTSFNWDATRTLELANNNLYLTDADGNSFYVTNANIIGTFGDGSNRCGRWSGVEAVVPQVDITTIEDYATKNYVDDAINGLNSIIGSGVI